MHRAIARARTALLLVGGACALSWPSMGEAAFVPPATNGKIAFTRGETDFLGESLVAHRVLGMSPAGAGLKQISDGSGSSETDDFLPEFSNDGSRIVFKRVSAAGARLVVSDSDGTDAKVVPHGAGDFSTPNFSPDGKRIIYAGNADGDWDIYSVGLDGQNRVKLTQTTVDEWTANVSGTGVIVFTKDVTGGNEVFSMKMDGSLVTRLTDAPGTSFSPDITRNGTLIAFVSNRDGNGEIYWAKSDGSGVKRLTQDSAADVSPEFSPDGTQIAWSTNRWDDVEFWNFDIARAHLADSITVRLTKLTTTDVSPAWQPLVNK